MDNIFRTEALRGGMFRWLSILFMAVAFSVGATAQQGLKISELMYQPRSGEAEWVELYNDSGAEVELSDYCIVRVLHDTLSTRYPLPAGRVAAHDYVVLTKDAASVVANHDVRYVTKMVECNLPAYPNAGGAVVLCTTSGDTLEWFVYSPSMHSPMLHNTAGVSLERRDFGRDVNAAGNWFSASSTSGYGTPGYANSQSAEWLVAETEFEFSSDVVSPDGDGYQDVLVISYAMNRGDLMADVAVYNAGGIQVAQMLDAAVLGSHGVVEWDSRDVPQGRYVVVITVYDRGGRRQIVRRAVAVMR